MKASQLRVGDRVKRPGWGMAFTIEHIIGDQVYFKNSVTAHSATDWLLFERAFKVGDRVRSLRGGSALEVGFVAHGGIFVATNGYVYETKDFEIVLPAAPSRKAIVCLIENDVPRPATRPFVHPSLASAETESRRLAVANPGQTFGTFELTSLSFAPKPPKPIAETKAA